MHEIKANDISDLHYKLRKTPVTANRAIAVLSSLLNWCEQTGYRKKDSNPVRGIKKYKERPPTSASLAPESLDGLAWPSPERSEMARKRRGQSALLGFSCLPACDALKF